MITVTKKDLITLGYGPSFAANIIKESKKLMVSKGRTYYQSRKLNRVPKEAVEELLGIILLLFMTGMRIGEAAALQWSDIDFETGMLNIDKTLYYKSSDEYKFVEPKTQANVRTIYIDADTIRAL